MKTAFIAALIILCAGCGFSDYRPASDQKQYKIFQDTFDGCEFVVLENGHQGAAIMLHKPKCKNCAGWTYMNLPDTIK